MTRVAGKRIARHGLGWNPAGMTKPRTRLAAAVRLATVAASIVTLGGCTLGVLAPAGPVGHAENMIFYDALVIMLAVVVPTILAVLAFAWWFRAGNVRAKYRPDFAYSGQIELVVWFIPLLVILLLAGVIWTGSHELDPARPLATAQPLRSGSPTAPQQAAIEPLEVQVVSLDWKWLFIYPAQGIASVNALVVPAGLPVHYTLTSASVMNAFFIPQLGSMIYTMNGMTTQLNLAAAKPGVFEGLSSHYSGEGFSDMRFHLTAVPPADFAAWVAAARGHGPVLDAAGYRALMQQSVKVAPFTYATATPGLFNDIVLQRLAPGPGPGLKSPGTAQTKTPAS